MRHHQHIHIRPPPPNRDGTTFWRMLRRSSVSDSTDLRYAAVAGIARTSESVRVYRSTST